MSLSDLPKECINHIIGYLELMDWCSCRQASKIFHVNNSLTVNKNLRLLEGVRFCNKYSKEWGLIFSCREHHFELIKYFLYVPECPKERSSKILDIFKINLSEEELKYIIDYLLDIYYQDVITKCINHNITMDWVSVIWQDLHSINRKISNNLGQYLRKKIIHMANNVFEKYPHVKVGEYGPKILELKSFILLAIEYAFKIYN